MTAKGVVRDFELPREQAERISKSILQRIDQICAELAKRPDLDPDSVPERLVNFLHCLLQASKTLRQASLRKSSRDMVTIRQLARNDAIALVSWLWLHLHPDYSEDLLPPEDLALLDRLHATLKSKPGPGPRNPRQLESFIQKYAGPDGDFDEGYLRRLMQQKAANQEIVDRLSGTPLNKTSILTHILTGQNRW